MSTTIDDNNQNFETEDAYTEDTGNISNDYDDNDGVSFEDTFQQQVGMTFQEAQQIYVMNSLTEAWDCSPKVAKQRLEQTITAINKLPEGDRAQYDSVEGIINYYAQLQQPKPSPAVTPSIVFNKKPPATTSVPLAKVPFNSKTATTDEVIAYQARIFDELKAEGINCFE